MARLSDHFGIIKGHISKSSYMFVTSNPEADGEDIPNGQLFILDAAQTWTQRTFEWRAVGLATVFTPSPELVVLGRDGDALAGSSAGYVPEDIEDGGVGPEQRGPMRDIRNIGETLVAVGMGRQVYRRLGPNSWQRLEAGFPTGEPPTAIVGLNAVDGSHLGDLRAVGWGGEIWHYNGVDWAKIVSPTNMALFDVYFVPPDTWWACGQMGTILRATNDRWEPILHDGAELDFRSLAWFAGGLYLADGTSLHRLDGNSLQAVPLIAAETAPVHHLHRRDDRLLASGRNVALVTNDGITWTELPV